MPLTSEQIYKIGCSVRALMQVTVEDTAQGVCGPLERLYYDLTSANLARIEHEPLYKLYSEMKKRYDSLSSMDVDNVRMAANRVDAVLRGELNTTRAFAEMTPTQGTLDYARLCSQGVNVLFGDYGIFYKLPEMTRKDLEEAARCLSYQCPTASVMIGLRAVEGMLRRMYRVLAGEERVDPWKTLGDELVELAEKRNLSVGKLFSYLDWIRTIRNQAGHPDRRFTVLEAEQLLMDAARSIELMQKGIDQLESKT